METPSSTRRVTRSQAFSAVNSNNCIPMSRKFEESEKGISKSKQRNEKQQQDRSALIDITNDSPIVGLAMGSLETPSSSMSKKRTNSRAKYSTPGSGSGEALLRDQVKNLLQKVEEEAEFSKLSLGNRPFLHLQGLLVNSPSGLLAPTPANTPAILNLSANGSDNKNELNSISPSPVEDKFVISQMITEIFDGKKQESVELETSLITRSLLLDFSDKSVCSDSSKNSSVLTYQEGDGGESDGREKLSTEDDDNASIWSIQVNASSKDYEEEEEDEDEEGLEEVEEDSDKGEDYEEEGEEEDDVDGGLVDELCEGISKISVNGEKPMAKFAGKHTRFVYNSDDELEGEEEWWGGESESSSIASSGVLCLKGLPTPKGKHLRFPEGLEED